MLGQRGLKGSPKVSAFVISLDIRTRNRQLNIASCGVKGVETGVKRLQCELKRWRFRKEGVGRGRGKDGKGGCQALGQGARGGCGKGQPGAPDS